MPEKPNQNDKMLFFEHLEDLRTRILVSLAAVAACSAIAYYYLDRILAVITAPVGKLVFISVLEAFSVKLEIAFYCGILLAAPVMIHQIYRFLQPALFPEEKKYFAIGVLSSYALFICGVVFGFYAVVPIGVKILLSYGSDNITPLISFGSYIGFVASLLIGFGCMFQLPVAVAFLTKLGIITPEVLTSKRRHAVIVIFLLAGIITPGPDIFSQVLVAIPTLFLYEISIWVSKYLYKQAPAEPEVELSGMDQAV